MSRAISKSRNAIAIVALATLLSGAATREAGAGVRIGIGGPLGVAAVSRFGSGPPYALCAPLVRVNV